MDINSIGEYMIEWTRNHMRDLISDTEQIIVISGWHTWDDYEEE